MFFDPVVEGVPVAHESQKVNCMLFSGLVCNGWNHGRDEREKKRKKGPAHEPKGSIW